MPVYDDRRAVERRARFEQDHTRQDLSTPAFERAPEHQRFQAMAEKYLELLDARDQLREALGKGVESPEKQADLSEQLTQMQKSIKDLGTSLKEQDQRVEQELSAEREKKPEIMKDPSSQQQSFDLREMQLGAEVSSLREIAMQAREEIEQSSHAEQQHIQLEHER